MRIQNGDYIRFTEKDSVGIYRVNIYCVNDALHLVYTTHPGTWNKICTGDFESLNKIYDFYASTKNYSAHILSEEEIKQLHMELL